MNLACNRTFLLILLSISLHIRVFGQENEYTHIDKSSKKAPLLVSYSYKSLSHYLTDRYITDEEKVRSIYIWIIHNIKYDVKAIRTGRIKKEKPNRILIKRKAICQGYSDLFKAMCNEVGIDARVVVGYDKGSNYEATDIFVRDDHAWNAVNVSGGWQLIDLTWSAGNLIPRNQFLRRYLYFKTGLPFERKYKFVKKVNYHYYFTDPKIFSIDHLPTYSWWQLSANKSILEFERDSAIRKADEKISYSEPISVNIPIIDISEEPIDYLKKAKETFDFNSKNFKAIAENKSMGAYKWYNQTLANNELDDSTKLFIYDSCKVLINEGKKDILKYISYTNLERDLRINKNKEYSNNSIEIIKMQKNQLSKEKLLISSTEKDISKEISKNKNENKSLTKEIKYISNNSKLPSRKNPKNSNISKSEFEYYHSLNDSINNYRYDILETNSLKKELFSIEFSQQKLKVDDLFSSVYKTISNKFYLRYYFNWNYKQKLNSLENRHVKLSHAKDSLLLLQAYIINQFKETKKEESEKSLSIRKNYRKLFNYNQDLYQISTDSLIEELNVLENISKIKNDWENYNKIKIIKNKKEIEKLAKNKKEIKSYTKSLKKENKLLSFEFFTERFRYKHFNRHYYKFSNRKKKKARDYNKNLTAFQKLISSEKKRCKERIRESEKIRQ